VADALAGGAVQAAGAAVDASVTAAKASTEVAGGIPGGLGDPRVRITVHSAAFSGSPGDPSGLKMP